VEIIVETIAEKDPPVEPAPESPGKYARSNLTPLIRKRIKRKLEQAVAGKLYIDSAINLRTLCVELKENAHYVSQVISQDLDSSFYAWVNQHRVVRAQQLLKQSPGQSVLEIALAVGFNSKSTFNTAFRRYTGMTPTAFRAAEEK
jgi:AraC-like DNA-binding protein